MAYQTDDPHVRAQQSRIAAERRYPEAPKRGGSTGGIVMAVGLILVLILGIAMIVPVGGDAPAAAGSEALPAAEPEAAPVATE